MKATVAIVPENSTLDSTLPYAEAAAISYRAQARRHNLTVTKITDCDQDDEVTVEGTEADLRSFINEVGWSTEATGFMWVVVGDALVTVDEHNTVM